MENIQMHILGKQQEIPYDLLYLADPSKEAVQSYIEKGITVIATIDGLVIGAYVLIHTRPFTIELVNIAVKEAYQNRGIGKQMIEDAISRSRDLNARQLEVGTGNSSIGQLALYQKCGFRIVGVDLDFFPKHYDKKIMENGIWCRDMIRLSMTL